jgi:hypothetical protein
VVGRGERKKSWADAGYMGRWAAAVVLTRLRKKKNGPGNGRWAAAERKIRASGKKREGGKEMGAGGIGLKGRVKSLGFFCFCSKPFQTSNSFQSLNTFKTFQD